VIKGFVQFRISGVRVEDPAFTFEGENGERDPFILRRVIDALRRNSKIKFIHVRHEEYGVFAAVNEAYLPTFPLRYAEPPGLA
jgi:hypothetical protein